MSPDPQLQSLAARVTRAELKASVLLEASKQVLGALDSAISFRRASPLGLIELDLYDVAKCTNVLRQAIAAAEARK